MTNTAAIYISSVLLEKNRWDSRIPSLKISDWLKPIADAGFDGLELWENHLLLADAAEREAVIADPMPITVLNTYCAFDDPGAKGRAASAELAHLLNVPAVKFNFGDKPAMVNTYMNNLITWRDVLPVSCRLLCECHPDTILEEPMQAADILSPLPDQLEIIVHAFGGDDDSKLRLWIEAFGSAVTHVHAVVREKTVASERIKILKNAGFSGTWTIEFCDGVAHPPEDMRQLLATATGDLNYLRKELT
ncbi:MAG: hypothetical protein HN368_19135 [Spirochaetales bacterium]|nr:hypothetical protein [Spirochaetales bacterium]